MGSKNENKKNKEKKKKKNKGKDNLKSDNNSPPTTSHGKVITDPRFVPAHTDPRFREAPKRETKVAIDSRFKPMFTDKNFQSSSAPVDKRGKRKQNSDQSRNALRHYYNIDENEENKNKNKKKKKKVEEEKDSSDEEKDEEEHGLIELNSAKLDDDDGTQSEETSESESALDIDVNTDTDTDEEGVDDKYYEEEEADVEEEIVAIEKETHRLAVVNMDWTYVKAVDLYVLLSSFVPPNGMIKSVAVYPTEFGIQQMKEEDVRGPVGLFDDENEKGDEHRSDNDDDTENEKLRAYEKSKMRYYHAVVECDSIATADHVYKECDGLEFLHSSIPLDLRFIPDDMEFKQPPRDVATEPPANYKQKDFYSRALQHSNVELTWDADDPLRGETLNRQLSELRTLKRDLNDEQLAELEMKDLFASDVSDDDDDDDGEDINETEDRPDKRVSLKDAYRGLLCSGNGSDEDAEHVDQDMEVTFNTALQDLNKHITEKKDQQSETTWDAYLRKRREKKKARKHKSKYSSDDDDSSDSDHEATEEADDFFIEEPAVKKKKKSQSKNDKDHNLQDMDVVDEEATKEELELLLADDKGTDTGLKGYNLKFKKGKGKKGESAIDEEKIPSSSYNDDPRFSALFSPEYAIDPTDPQFKRSASYVRQMAQKQQKSHVELSVERESMNLPEETKLSSDGSGMMQKGEKELSSLVKSIKMKSKQLQLSSDGKTKDRKSHFKGKGKRKH